MENQNLIKYYYQESIDLVLHNIPDITPKEFPINPDQLKKIGLIINQARERSSISIESLAESLRISKDRLVSLENGHKEFLPESVFIVGMIRRVAVRLKLDADSLINELYIDPNLISEQESIKESDPKSRRWLGFLSMKKQEKSILKIKNATF